MASHHHREDTPLLAGPQFINVYSHSCAATDDNEKRRNVLWALFLSAACVMTVYTLNISMYKQHHGQRASLRRPGYAGIEEATERSDAALRPELGHSNNNNMHHHSSPEEEKSPYTKVQTLSFQIYTGGAPAFIKDEETGEKVHNHECKGLHSYGLPENSESLQCYLGLQDTAKDIQRRLNIMTDAVDRAHDVSDKDDSTLKIFLAPEFYFRGLNGSFEFKMGQAEDYEEHNGECSDICHILKGLENIAAQKRYENWLFLFGTVIASEVLPKEDTFDYQFYNFAPLYKGFDPVNATTSKRIGKNFIVPKRYVSNMDFLTPVRHLTNKTIAMELLDGADDPVNDHDHELDQTVMNPHANGHKRYDNEMWGRYKDELQSELGYTMIEYGWFYMDNISFSVEICLDHLVHRALMTYLADGVTGSKTRIPSSSSRNNNNNEVEWVGIPKQQAQISLVSSAGMDVTVSSLALANGGHVFLQDGMDGGVEPHSTYGEDDCQLNEFEFFGGSQAVKRTAVVAATDVTFEYDMNLNFKDYNLYPKEGPRYWKHVLKGVFSSTAYQPRLTVYDPVGITLT